MERKKIEEILEKEKNANLMLEMEYDGKNYIKAMIHTKDKIEYQYYEILEDSIIPVEDENVLEYFRSIYEIQESNIIY